MASDYARGGYVSGSGVTITVTPVGACAKGHPLFRLGDRADAPREHIISAAEVRTGDLSKMACDA